jgi:acetyl esterase
MLKQGALPLESSTIAELREGARALRARWPRGPATHSSEDRSFEGHRFRIYRPTEAARLPALIFFHGGGWTLMDIDTHDAMARGLAAASGAALLAIDYPLAPEAPFPAGLDLCQRFTEFVAVSPGTLGLVPGAFALAGDSAGANLAVAVALRLRDAGKTMPNALALLYGAYDGDTDRDSYRRYGAGDLPFSRARMEFFLRAYLRNPADRTNPLFASLRADAAGLPPAFLAAASHDALLDENVAMADHLRAAGCEARLKVYPGTILGFAEAASAVGAKIAKQALADCGDFLAKALRPQ